MLACSSSGIHLSPPLTLTDNADLNLSKRTSFPWFVLRPSTLKDDAGTDKVNLAVRKGISTGVPRQDVADTFLALAQLPRGYKGVDGQMWDLTGDGDVTIQQAVQQAAQQGRSDWLG